MTDYIAIGGDAHSDVTSIGVSIAQLARVKAGVDKVIAVYRGGDDGADPRFKGYKGLSFQSIAKIAKARGFKGAARYSEVIRAYKEGLIEDRDGYFKLKWDINGWATEISHYLGTAGVPVRMIAGNADLFQDAIRAVSKNPSVQILKETSADYFNRDNISYKDQVSLDIITPDGLEEFKEGIAGRVAILTIPYSFDVETERNIQEITGVKSDTPARLKIKTSLNERLEQLQNLHPNTVIQIQHEPPVQSLVSMLDPRNRPLEAVEVYQTATDAITDMKPSEHMIFYGHVGNKHFAQSVPHELADKNIRTFHWPELGGNMLYLDLSTYEVREERFI